MAKPRFLLPPPPAQGCSVRLQGKAVGWKGLKNTLLFFLQRGILHAQIPVACQTLKTWIKARQHYLVLGTRLRKVSYEAFVFPVFSRNQGKTKPLTWLSVSSLLQSQAAPNFTTSRHNLMAIQLSIKTSLTWQFESLRLIFIHFRLAQVTRLRQMFEMSHADLKQWRAQRVLRRRISFVQDSIWKASTLSVRFLKSTSPEFRRLESEICVDSRRQLEHCIKGSRSDAV